MKTIMNTALIIILVVTSVLSAQSTSGDVLYTPPVEIEELRPRFHYEPVNQDTTNACWSFSTLSFIESELQRINGQSTKLAVMYPVYYANIEKMKRFVETRGQSRFTPGDLFPTVVDIIKTYGILPDEVYPGQTSGKETYNHEQMETEIEDLKNSIIENDLWIAETSISDLQQILNKYLGEPPSEFNYRDENLTAMTFAEKYVNLPWDDYILITSFGYAPFNSFTALNVPDNWQNIDRYFNVELELFYSSMKSALENGYTLAIDGDIKEPGRVGPLDACFIPNYDIPGAYIDQAARDYRFDKGVTEDDHLMHIVGFGEVNGEEWFLVKDSWRDAWEGKHKGYFFYHRDYARLKILAYMVHKDGVPDIVNLVQ